MPDDKKAKDKQSKDAAAEETTTEATPKDTGAETGSSTVTVSAAAARTPLSRERAERLRRKLKAKFH